MATKITPDEIARLSSMTWNEYDEQLEAAYAELNEQIQGNNDEDVVVYAKEWDDYFEAIKPDKPPVTGNNVEAKPDPNNPQIKTGVHIDELKIGLVDSLDKLNPDVLQDIFYYMPSSVRSYVIDHEFVLEVLTHYMADYIVQPEKNEFETLKYVIEYAKSLGLAFRKMYSAKGAYAVLFFSYSDRTDETMIDDFLMNADMMMYDETVDIEKRIDEQSKRDFADNFNSDFADGSMIRLDGRKDNDKFNNITIKQQDTTLSWSEVNDFIYSSVNLMIYYKLDIDSLPKSIKENNVLIISHLKYANIKCKFHCLNYLVM